MKKLLKSYIQKVNNWDEIHVDYWNVDGAICTVNFYTDTSKHYKETEIINIWDMLIFMNDIK